MAYVSLAEAKSHLSITGSGHDSVITPLVEAAQTAIDEYTQQRWESPASAAKFYVVERYDCVLDIAFAQSVSEVAEKQDGSWSALDDEDWEVVETDAAIDRLVRTEGFWQCTRRGEASVRVTGVFATTASAPADIAEATLLLVARLFQRRNAPLGLTAGGVETAAMHLARHDPDVHTLLHPRRQRAVG